MPNRSKQKGQRFEYQVRDYLREHGIPAKLTTQVPQSAGIPGDLLVPMMDGPEHLWELKHRANGFKQLYKWLEHSKALVVKADRKPALIVMKLEDWV